MISLLLLDTAVITSKGAVTEFRAGPGCVITRSGDTIRVTLVDEIVEFPWVRCRCAKVVDLPPQQTQRRK